MQYFIAPFILYPGYHLHIPYVQLCACFSTLFYVLVPVSGSMSYSQMSKQLVTYHGDSDDEDTNSNAKISDDSELDNSEIVSVSASPIL